MLSRFGFGRKPNTEVASTTTPENQADTRDKPDTRHAIHSLRTEITKEVFSKYKPQLHEFIQGIGG